MDKLTLTPEQQEETIALFVQFQQALHELKEAQEKFEQERARISSVADKLGIPQLMKRSTWQKAITIDSVIPVRGDVGILRHYNTRTGELLSP
jgi:hypothetical protein